MDDEVDLGLSHQDAGAMPRCCTSGHGAGPILLVAPHGGRRAPVDASAPPRRLRVNDVYTPEVTRELAAVLDASWIVNSGMDRNLLDLNRVSQVRKHAPWFLEILVKEMERIIARHGGVEVLFVHGWNTGQTSCDVGIGAVENAAGLQLTDGAYLTVSESYRHARIATLRSACERRGIRMTLGARYPGSHPNNLLQLLTPRAARVDHPCAARIAVWVAQGRVNALQLELGLPLRWPGRWRSAFVAAMAEAFGSRSHVPAPCTVPAPQRSRVRTASSLQFYDPSAGFGLSAGVGRVGPHGLGGRMLLFLGGERA